MTDRPAPQKSADAYRTISEVADELNLPQHVLRFWETRFPQVKPLKRAGGRRFYRPEDVALLRAVQALLYGEGYTIRGVQRLLAEHGARHVADALARSRAGPPRDAGDAGDDATPERDASHGRREPALPLPVPPRPVPPRPVPAPSHPLAPDSATRAGDGTSVVDRLAAVLADLDDARRLLASVRSTGN